MAIEAVQELVTKLKNVQAQITEKQAELEKLRKAHLDFWAKFQKECSETGHSLTQEEREELAEYNKPKKVDTRPYWVRRMRRATDNYEHASLTQFDIRICNLFMHGYRCAYCLRRVPGKVEDRSPRLDLCKRESFDKWLGYQEDKWPSDKRVILKKVKKEIDKYFAKAEPLEQEIERLKEEEKEYRDLLDPIWKLLDNALGYAKQRKKHEEAVRDGYEQRIRDIEYAHRPSPPFGDSDAFWD